MPCILTINGDVPVKKNRQRIGKHGGIYKDPASRDFEELVGWEAKVQKLVPVKGKVKVTIAVRVKRDRDADGVATTMLDAMQYAGLIENDKHVMELHVYKTQGDDPKCVVRVEPWDSSTMQKG